MEEFRIAYITCGSLEEAKLIGKRVVEEKLAACANCIPNMQSIYIWNEKLQEDSETILLLKTVVRRIPELITRVKELHSYENPCIVFIELKEGSTEYLEWVRKMTL